MYTYKCSVTLRTHPCVSHNLSRMTDWLNYRTCLLGLVVGTQQAMCSYTYNIYLIQYTIDKVLINKK